MFLKLQEWFISRVETKAVEYWLVFLATAESVIFPIPIDPLLVATVMANTKKWAYYAFITTGASVVGAVIGYFLASVFFDTIGQSIVSFYGAYEQFAYVQSKFNQGVFLFTIIAAVTPIPFKILVLSAGFSHANFFLFIIASVIGRAFRMYLVSFLTFKFGEMALALLKKYSIHLLFAGLFVILFYILFFMNG